MNLPSVKTLSRITDHPQLLRTVLECGSPFELRELVRSKPELAHTAEWVRSCYHTPGFHSLKMHIADELCNTYGVEYIPEGHNSKSPAIEYLNAGDTYTATLLYVNGRYRVGCWGDIIERGRYD